MGIQNDSRQEGINDIDTNILDDGTVGINCDVVIQSEEYVDLIREYNFEMVQNDMEEFGADCFQILNQKFAVFHVPLEGRSCDEVYKSVPFIEVPDVFGLASRRSLEASGIYPIYQLPGLQLTGRDVIVGVIDTGIDYTHEAFIYEDGTTKILSIWDQTASEGEPPERFRYGVEYTEEQINEALQSDDPYSIVPEKDELTHGTYVAGIAAGRARSGTDFSGAAPDASLVVVKLKPAKKCVMDYYLFKEGAIGFQSNDIILASRYLLQKADQLQKPLVMIFAGGTSLSAHEGNSITEQHFNSLGSINGLVTVIPSGDESNTSHHFRGQLLIDDLTEINMEINVDDNERGFFVFMWNAAPDRNLVSITSPSGYYTDIIPLESGVKQEITLILEQTQILVEYHVVELLRGEQATFIRFKNPTPGIWTITVHGEQIVSGIFDAYLPLTNFVEKNTIFVSPDPFVTVTDPGDAFNVVTVGGYNDVSGSLYLPSGRGFTRNNLIKPDIVAPSAAIRGPIPNNQYGFLSGTSAGAAITAGACALLLEWAIVRDNNPNIDTLGAKNYLIRGATRRPAISYPNREWGFGELNLLGTFQEAT